MRYGAGMRAQRGDNREGVDAPGVERRPTRAIGVQVGDGPIYMLIAPDRPLPTQAEARFAYPLGGEVRVQIHASEIEPGLPVPQPLPWRRVGELVLRGAASGDVLVDVLLFADVVDVRAEDAEARVAIEERFDL
ncbi:MAG: hypothetical protein EP330_23885 [Deltaproteobacteria bacterium]|nr:MAG: hypothetical protein EP330_23885 [Deltaproteobacteria bacterium]